MNDVIKTIKSLEDSNILIVGITETVKYEIRKQEGGFIPALLTPLVTSLVQPVISSVVKGIIGRGVRRAGREYVDKIFLFCCNIKIIKYFNDFNYFKYACI